MNIFIFKKIHDTNDVPSLREKLKAIHADLCDMGYNKTFREFYDDLSEYCEPYLDEDDKLSSAVAKPYLEERLLQIIESLEVGGLRSRIFATCGSGKRFQTAAIVPCMHIETKGVLKAILRVFPELAKEIRILPEKLIGFAAPVYETIIPDEEYLSIHEGIIHDIRFGKRDIVIGPKSEEKIITVPAKVSFTVKIGNFLYEFPVYWNEVEDANLIHTRCIQENITTVQIHKMESLSVEEYTEQAKKQLDLLQKNMQIVRKGRK